MKSFEERLKEVEDVLGWTFQHQTVLEARLEALVQEMEDALKRAGWPSEAFRKRLEDLEGEKLKGLIEAVCKMAEAEIARRRESEPPPQKE